MAWLVSHVVSAHTLDGAPRIPHTFTLLGFKGGLSSMHTPIDSMAARSSSVLSVLRGLGRLMAHAAQTQAPAISAAMPMGAQHPSLLAALATSRSYHRGQDAPSNYYQHPRDRDYHATTILCVRKGDKVRVRALWPMRRPSATQIHGPTSTPTRAGPSRG
jgi:hypothetical protein